MNLYLHATPEVGIQFYQNYAGKGKVVMLNLLRYREMADYFQSPNIAPKEELDGRTAYKVYMKQAAPLIQEVGGEVLLWGESQQFLIGPEAEKWDAVLLVQYPSAEQFVAFAQSEAYQKVAPYRTAALADSRLLPILPK
ncbi:MAG: DUF1330 domain-containing protein [Bacteroidota bacterium]